MEILKVANVCVTGQTDQLIKLEVGQVLSTCISEDPPAELRSKVEIVDWLVLQCLLDEMQGVHQVSDTSDLLVVGIGPVENEAEVVPESAVAAEVDDLFENVLRCEQALEGCEGLLGFRLRPVVVDVES